MFSSVFLAAGISFLIQARGIKALMHPQPKPVLGQAEYARPQRNEYDTDELSASPPSVTEHTTTHLQLDPDIKTISVPEK